MQWGITSINTATSFTITFPISFTTTNYGFAEIDEASAANAGQTIYKSRTKSSFTGSCSNTAKTIIWIAIGY